MSEDIVTALATSATERGWIKRPDMGLNVWETENGTLYQHFDCGEPTLLIADWSKIFKTPG